jgi:hypothetical protein
VEFVGDEEMLCRLAIGVTAGNDGVFVEDGLWQLPAVREAPGWGGRGGIVLDVFDGAAAFEQEGAEAVLAKFLGGPAAADPGADDDGVVSVHIMIVRRVI